MNNSTIKKEYKTSNINNRRYLGNKYKLLPFIKETIDNECKDFKSVGDIFAGTGAVSYAFNNKTLITNDLLYSNYICNYAWFASQQYNPKKIIDYIISFNSYDYYENNYMTENFADTYFSKNDCSKIGYIRECIENEFINNKINERERAILITSLLYAMDRIANTCGHYDSFRQNVKFSKSLELYVPIVKIKNNKDNRCYNKDANELVKEIKVDLIYMDPPYNSRQYCDAYHMLENVSQWKKPKVFGIAKKMDRTTMKSKYCTKSATETFEGLVKSINAKYIVLSYNNMAEKGNDRSNARISDEDISRILSSKGELKIFSKNYKAFTTGKSDILDNEERLFICKCE